MDSRWFGGILILLGGLFLLDQFLPIHLPSLWRIFWPLLLIVLGLFLLRRRSFTTTGKGAGAAQPAHVFNVFGSSVVHAGELAKTPAGRTIDAVVIFGDLTLYVPDDWRLQWDVVTIFGDNQDLRARPTSTSDPAAAAPSRDAAGTAEATTPGETASDAAETQDAGATQDVERLLIRGLVLFGDVKVRSAR